MFLLIPQARMGMKLSQCADSNGHNILSLVVFQTKLASKCEKISRRETVWKMIIIIIIITWPSSPFRSSSTFYKYQSSSTGNNVTIIVSPGYHIFDKSVRVSYEPSFCYRKGHLR